MKHISLRTVNSIKKNLKNLNKYNEKALKELYFNCSDIYDLSNLNVLTKHTSDDLSYIPNRGKESIYKKFKNIIIDILKTDFDIDIKNLEKLIKITKEDLENRINPYLKNFQDQKIIYEAVMKIIEENKLDITETDLGWLDYDEDINIINSKLEQFVSSTSRVIVSETIYTVQAKFRNLGIKQTKITLSDCMAC